ncbi:MAG TPA: I78 family peptidase inhibitor [Allosphingosinicella sp.]|nr:I78 family peptidase inhibitor [Allosphingosinicella sp.]
MRALALAALLTAGCATAPAAEAGGVGKCDAAGAQKLIGQAKSAKVGNEALRLSGAKALRWIAPGTMVTMDYREDRLNLRTDPAGKVVKVDCG